MLKDSPSLSFRGVRHSYWRTTRNLVSPVCPERDSSPAGRARNDEVVGGFSASCQEIPGPKSRRSNIFDIIDPLLHYGVPRKPLGNGRLETHRNDVGLKGHQAPATS